MAKKSSKKKGNKRVLKNVKNTRKRNLKTKKKKKVIKTLPKTRRAKCPYPALEKGFNLKSRSHLNDYDYLHKLTEEELKWLNKFHDEFYNAAVNKDPKKNKFNKTRKEIKARYSENNARNRDIRVKHYIHELDAIKNVVVDKEEEMNARVDLQIMGYLDENGYRIRKKKAD